jgi:hypothetical protein
MMPDLTANLNLFYALFLDIKEATNVIKMRFHVYFLYPQVFSIKKEILKSDRISDESTL